ncbi:MAG: DDE-type integrase/transposase/recombinase [Nitrosotalea sp.]
MNQRETKGQQIANNKDQIRRVDPHYYTVKSQSGKGDYDVVLTESGWDCSCPDHTFRKICCKHIHAVEFSLQMRKSVESFVIPQIEANCCKFYNSTDIIKKGLRKNKTYSLQVYKCRVCNKKFSINLGFERMKASPQVITSAMQLYFTGESLRNVQKFLELQGIQITHKTVWNWIRKYVNLMESYLDQIVPQVGDKWRADELYLKVKGNTKYLYALMDDDTRFWIAQQISDNKYRDDISQMFRNGKEATGKKPSVLITDGARNFETAWKKEFRQKNFLDTKTEHVRHIHFDGDKNNNKMERLNGELRDREKVMRSLKSVDSPILAGMQIHHNFIRCHMGLEGKTPSEVAGIKVEGSNKWITLIQNAVRK